MIKLYNNLIIYNLIIFITLLFSIIEMSGVKLSINIKRIYILIYVFFISLYGSQSNISADLEAYKNIFLNPKATGVEYIYIKLAGFFHGNYEAISFVIILFQMIAFYAMILKEKYMFTIIYLFGIFNFYENITILRQSLALSIFILSIKYIRIKKGKILILLSLLFHHFIFFNISLLFIKIKKYKVNNIIKTSIILVIVGIFGKNILSILVENIDYLKKYLPYLNKINLNLFGKIYKGLSFLIEYFVVYYVIFKGYKILKKNELFKQLVIGNYISLFFLFSGISFYVSERILFSVNRSLFLLLPLILEKKNKKIKMYLEILVLTLFYLLFKNIHIYLIRLPIVN